MQFVLDTSVIKSLLCKGYHFFPVDFLLLAKVLKGIFLNRLRIGFCFSLSYFAVVLLVCFAFGFAVLCCRFFGFGNCFLLSVRKVAKVYIAPIVLCGGYSAVLKFVHVVSFLPMVGQLKNSKYITSAGLPLCLKHLLQPLFAAHYCR